MTRMIKTIGMISRSRCRSLIPLIARIVKRKSAEDISLVWVFGIGCASSGMLPGSLVSSIDPFRLQHRQHRASSPRRYRRDLVSPMIRQTVDGRRAIPSMANLINTRKISKIMVRVRCLRT